MPNLSEYSAHKLEGYEHDGLRDLTRANPGRFDVYAVNHSLGLRAKDQAHVDRYNGALDSLVVEGHFHDFEGDPAWINYHRGGIARACEAIYGAGQGQAGILDGGLSYAISMGMQLLYRPEGEQVGIGYIANDFCSDQVMVRTLAQKTAHERGIDGESVPQAITADNPNGIITTDTVLSFIEQAKAGLAMLLIPEIHYLTGARIDAVEVSRLARQYNIAVISDTAHALGNIPLHYGKNNEGPDWAAGCSYKYLGAGPGLPAIVFVNGNTLQGVHQGQFGPQVHGWFSYDNPARFLREGVTSDTLDPRNLAPDLSLFRKSNVNILSAAAVWDALERWQAATPEMITEGAGKLKNYFLSLLKIVDANNSLNLITPAGTPGAMLTFAVSNELAEKIKTQFKQDHIEVDWRGQGPDAPQILRLSFHPVYNTPEDVFKVAKAIDQALNT